MSYMSGIMMGLALGKGLRRALTGRLLTSSGARMARVGVRSPFFQSDALPPSLTLARAISGRRRYYAAALQNNEALAKRLTEKITARDGIDEAQVNLRTGSLLLLYHGDETTVDRVMEEVMAETMETSTLPSLPGTVGNGLAAVGMSLRCTAADLNHRLKVATHGWLDLPSLMSLIFIVRGVQKILLLRQFPSGPQLLWWAFSLLRGWRIV